MRDDNVRTRCFHSRSADEVSEYIGNIYSGNRFMPRSATANDVSIVGRTWNDVGIYDFDSRAPFSFETEEVRSNYLFVLGTHGSAQRTSGHDKTICTIDDVVPTSSVGIAKTESGRDGFGHRSIVVSAERLGSFLDRWTGRELTHPIRFALRPLDVHVASEWKIATHCLYQMTSMAPMPDTAIDSLFEHMLKILVTGHPSNYSALLTRERYTADRLTHSAIVLIRADPMRWKTLSAVALALDCPASELESGIVRSTGKPVRELFYEARMQAVNGALRGAQDLSFSATLGQYGFSLSKRFAYAYRLRFGELPDATYRRNPNGMGRAYPSLPLRDALCKRTINQFIDARLDQSIDLSDLARFVGLGEAATIAAFKACFARTPIQYVIERRLERARKLLQDTSTSIVAIALECGFGSQSHLTTTMKKHFGVTPHQLRVSRSKSPH